MYTIHYNYASIILLLLTICVLLISEGGGTVIPRYNYIFIKIKPASNDNDIKHRSIILLIKLF